ncbi:hypothetical protein [uncultured Maribacter sp.]|uniref:hypothetical protein n=1 Tax=uncultured Maribacter sp. TaxID=431308 RepID=UPI002608EDE5|nr:hypothetical protein [uncultured Maribacter sp.]
MKQLYTRKTKSILTAVLSVLLLSLLTQCSKNPLKCATGSWARDITDDLEAFSNASQNYNKNPTVENCNTYKSALSNYLNSLEDLDNCYAGISDFDSELKSAREERDEIDCSEN